MDIANRETYGLLAVVLLVLIRQHSVDLAIQNFILRRRHLRVRFLQSLLMLYLFYRNRRLQVACWPRCAWIFPRPQNWFQELLNNRALDLWWKENFRVSRATFEYICRLVGPVLVKKRTAVSLWRLATGECYRSCGLMIGLAKPTMVKCCHEFVEAICNLHNDFIKFPSTRAKISRKIEGFSEKSKVPNVVAAIDGSHIPIKAPRENHKDYFNWKHFYSYLVQGIVDSGTLFICCH